MGYDELCPLSPNKDTVRTQLEHSDSLSVIDVLIDSAKNVSQKGVDLYEDPAYRTGLTYASHQQCIHPCPTRAIKTHRPASSQWLPSFLQVAARQSAPVKPVYSP